MFRTALHRRKLRRRGIALLLSAIACLAIVISPATGQSSSPKTLQELPFEIVDKLLSPNPPSELETGSVRLDGSHLFLVTALKIDAADEEKERVIPVNQRIEEIEAALRTVVQQDFDSNTLDVSYQTSDLLPVISVNKNPILVVTPEDAQISGITPEQRAEELVEIIGDALLRAKQERQPNFLLRQGAIAGGLALVTLALSLVAARFQRHLKGQWDILAAEVSRNSAAIASLSAEETPDSDIPNTTLLQVAQQQAKRRQRRNLIGIERLLLHVGQVAIWCSSLFVILGLFPYLRWLQLPISIGIRVPLQILGIGFVTYLAIRLSDITIGRIFWALEEGRLLSPEASQRLVLRVTTFSRTIKSVVGISLTALGILVALSVVGVPVGPILAGAGILGLAISFASQSVIKDAINGFLILVEDQYAVGDAIKLGDLAGTVEHMNLRITQLRNAEGSLITVPNGEIRAVINLSKEWSRVDLDIPIPYDADLQQTVALIEAVAEEMRRDEQWGALLVEPHQLMGVEDFSDRGVVVKIWQKTQPLKQWDVAREYRRRLKIAFDEVGIAIPVTQQRLWLREVDVKSTTAVARSKP